MDLIPGLGRSSRVGNDYPLQYSCLENPMDRRACWATVQKVTKGDMTEVTWHAPIPIFAFFLNFFLFFLLNLLLYFSP